ncbi:MAG TPA: 2-C-methyl-D-erythritol 2,4-cyclodiphosphate synthase [Solirubrobacteraceae bacterium]|nr:2-C-methyl-D-erythritol 2,4-cyclodiphosphate synthase [Solirubrobacteraceae bacterium]
MSAQRAEPAALRYGIGYDSHRLLGGRALTLGGVRVEHELGLAGHSDADVLTHAIIDALLGAAAMGDIGDHFPDSDERYRDADSLQLLAQVLAALADRGLAPWNVDATLLIERPKLGAIKGAIRERLAGALGLPPERVNVKASTGEGIGFVGRQEGVAALAIASLRELAQGERAPGAAAALGSER